MLFSSRGPAVRSIAGPMFGSIIIFFRIHLTGAKFWCRFYENLTSNEQCKLVFSFRGLYPQTTHQGVFLSSHENQRNVRRLRLRSHRHKYQYEYGSGFRFMARIEASLVRAERSRSHVQAHFNSTHVGHIEWNRNETNASPLKQQYSITSLIILLSMNNFTPCSHRHEYESGTALYGSPHTSSGKHEFECISMVAVHIHGAAKSSLTSLLKFFVVFSETVWNFNLQFYSFIH